MSDVEEVRAEEITVFARGKAYPIVAAGDGTLLALSRAFRKTTPASLREEAIAYVLSACVPGLVADGLVSHRLVRYPDGSIVPEFSLSLDTIEVQACLEVFSLVVRRQRLERLFRACSPVAFDDAVAIRERYEEELRALDDRLRGARARSRDLLLNMLLSELGIVGLGTHESQQV